MFAMNHRVVLSRYFVRRALSCTFAVALGFVALTATVSAQQYETIAPKMQEKASKALKVQAANAMRNQAAFSAGGKDTIVSYYKTYYFPVMTQTNPGALAGLGKKREDLMKLLRGATLPAAQDHLTKLTLGAMRALARDNYHPAVRYNATRILGMLDKKYSSGSDTPPEVLPAGTAELLELLEQKEFNGIKVHPSVKVGALEGLERHVRFGLDAQYAGRVTKVAMAVIAQKPSAIDVDADVNNWMKCQAARVLARQFKAGPNAEVHKALTELIASEAMSIEDRCCVVGLLKDIEYAGAAEADVASTLVPLGILTKEVVAEGAEKAKEFQDLRRGSAPAGGRGGGRGEKGPKFERRQLLSRLTLIAKGAISLSDGLAEEDKQKVQSLTDLLKPVVTISRDKKALDLDVTGEVIKLNRAIKKVVASWIPAEAAAPVEDADEDFTE